MNAFLGPRLCLENTLSRRGLGWVAIKVLFLCDTEIYSTSIMTLINSVLYYRYVFISLLCDGIQMTIFGDFLQQIYLHIVRANVPKINNAGVWHNTITTYNATDLFYLILF